MDAMSVANFFLIIGLVCRRAAIQAMVTLDGVAWPRTMRTIS